MIFLLKLIIFGICSFHSHRHVWHMSGLAGGYLESGASDSHVTNLQVLFGTGEAWTSRVSPNTLGREVGKLRLGATRNFTEIGNLRCITALQR